MCHRRHRSQYRRWSCKRIFHFSWAKTPWKEPGLVSTLRMTTLRCLKRKFHWDALRSWYLTLIVLYTPINYFGRYATCSHKDGGRSHIQSRETIGQENLVTCLELRPRVNLVLRLEPLTRRVFSINTSSSNTLSLLHDFFAAATHSLQCESTGVKSNNMDGPRRHSKYTMTMRLLPVSEKLPVSNHKKKDILNM